MWRGKIDGVQGDRDGKNHFSLAKPNLSESICIKCLETSLSRFRVFPTLQWNPFPSPYCHKLDQAVADNSHPRLPDHRVPMFKTLSSNPCQVDRELSDKTKKGLVALTNSVEPTEKPFSFIRNCEEGSHNFNTRNWTKLRKYLELLKMQKVCHWN